MRNIDQPGGTFHVLLHQVDEVGTARNEFGVRIGSDPSHRVRNVIGPCLLKADHACSIACWIAATMLGYAPHRQILPLMSSRISSALFALPSAIRPAAE